MARITRTSNVDTNSATGVTIGSTTPGTEFPSSCTGSVTAGVEFDISAVRVGTYSGSSASYPLNGTVTFRLRKFTGGLLPAGGSGATATAAPIGQSTN